VACPLPERLPKTVSVAKADALSKFIYMQRRILEKLGRRRTAEAVDDVLVGKSAVR
jgi:hypothetical protein